MRIAVAGGTGTVGRHVVHAAQERGHQVVTLTRSGGVDLMTGAGLDEALTGVDTVIDVANTTTLSAKKAVRFFETVSRTLLAVEGRAGVAHHVALSIVGIDGIDHAYYAGKLAQERAVMAGAVPWSIARAGQFHEFAGQLLGSGRGPVAVIPRVLTRPVAADEVAEHLVAVAEGGAAGRVPDLLGPQDEILAEMARRQLVHDGVRRRVLEVGLPGAYGRGLASGALRGSEPRLSGRLTFDEWLDSPIRVR